MWNRQDLSIDLSSPAQAPAGHRARGPSEGGVAILSSHLGVHSLL